MLVVHAVSLHAQQDTHLSALRTALAEKCVQLEARYKITMSQTRITGDAVIEVQGDAYVMKTEGMTVYCDGQTIWTVDEEAKEVYIEPVGTSDDMYSDNVLLSLINSDSVEFSFNDNGVLSHMKVLLPDSTSVSAEVMSFDTCNKKSVTFFQPQSEFGTDWVVTDMR